MGCSDKEDEEGLAGKEACGPAPAAVATTGLADNFPKPNGVVYTTSAAQGPSTSVEGYADRDLAGLFNDYKSTLNQAPFGVTKSERDAHDAEVNFAGPGNTGQVALTEQCKGRTGIRITVRPK